MAAAQVHVESVVVVCWDSDTDKQPAPGRGSVHNSLRSAVMELSVAILDQESIMKNASRINMKDDSSGSDPRREAAEQVDIMILIMMMLTTIMYRSVTSSSCGT